MDVGSARGSTPRSAQVWTTMSVVKEDLEKASRSSVQGHLHYPKSKDREPYIGGICAQGKRKRPSQKETASRTSLDSLVRLALEPRVGEQVFLHLMLVHREWEARRLLEVEEQ